MKYLVVVEKAERNYCAYLPDVPGCIATGKTRVTVLKRIREALSLHLEGLRHDGQHIPRPGATATLVQT